MNKKLFLALPCIATVAVALFVGKKTLNSNVYGRNSLFVEHVEALSEPNENGEKKTCWNEIHAKDGSKVMYCPICDYIEGTDDLFAWSTKCPK